ncbi:MAG TPA: glucans biosynthesis glucosyltransferase MdoH [Casimicrobiaceae bacterium]|nr:glucans biosynthesis glucosyltransferase MdoH [Casimicrobiaceae bacterium]
MELSAAAELSRAKRRPDAVDRYLDALDLPVSDKAALRRRIASRAGASGSAAAAFAAMHAELAHATGGEANPDDPARVSVRARLLRALSERTLGTRPLERRDSGLATAPPLARTSMAPSDWLRGSWSRWRERPVRAKPAAGTQTPAPALKPVSWYRRIVLAALIIGQTYVATVLMKSVLPYHGQALLEIPILVLFAILFGWVSAGFWTAIAGFLVLWRGRDRWAISRTAAPDAPIAESARTAIIMPIANEDVARVFAGLRATYESVARTGLLARFDFFVLSDSANPDVRVAELAAWFDLCRSLDAFRHVYYRWRPHRIKRKSGNVADFCRRWGKDYRYMIVLDADSVMTGDCVTTLVRIAEANPDAGILQTAPKATGRDTLYARVQQFATGVYGPVFTAGLHYWQLRESHYWGHNAIIRVAPFIEFCALGRLPGGGTLSGEILSHDFVEAALMRRAGWGVWIVYDLPGSYEEMPPNLIDELKRDRRWCQGNLMNFRLALMKGLHPAHRVVFMTGVMAYLSAPLWFAFLMLSTALLAVHTLATPVYFTEPYQLFPIWPQWEPQWALRLVVATGTILFLPKILAVVLVMGRRAHEFGGRLNILVSTLDEIILSMLLAPIRMLFHTRFVLTALAGWAVTWRSPARDDASTTWGYALRQHGAQTLFGVAWAAFVGWLNPTYLWWLAPVAGALIVSIPLSVYTSRASLGRRARRAGLFLIPEEVHVPREIRAMTEHFVDTPPPPTFATAIVDPVVNALVCAVAVDRRRFPQQVRDARAQLARDALQGDPSHLSAERKTRLLGDAGAMSWLHFHTWLKHA